MNATYSPEDNKLRLYSADRLDPETYQRVKAAGFIWAPRQRLFVAPMWTPYRAALLTELCGEIGDEDTSLVDRAEERAERFEDYGEKRAEDAHAAHAAVKAIADNIPFGQPILVGHHSERRARKAVEKIENGMRRAVKMWETSQYWQSRAAGAIRLAKYKELPTVRARRIKGLEADKRRHERDIERAEMFTKAWSASLAWDPEVRRLTREQARAIANYDNHQSICFTLKDFPRDPPASQYEGAMSLWSALGDTDEEAIITPEQARDIALGGHAGTIRHANRWLEHINNRLAYERAMLAEAGGLAAENFDVQIGGRVLRHGEWFTVTKLNKRGGKLMSVTVMGHWCSTIQVEEITDYKAPEAGDTEKVKAVTKLAPLCNYPGEGFRHMTKEESKHRRSIEIHTFPATETHGAYRSYSTFKGGSGLDCHDCVGVFLTDQKRKDPPPIPLVQPEPITIERQYADTPEPAPVYPTPEPNAFDAIRETLRAGIQVVSAPQLFPTPPELAARMVEEAGVEPQHRVLEPSAGTGRILDALKASDLNSSDDATGQVVAVELNHTVAQTLGRHYSGVYVRCADFLECNGELGTFDRIIMNPPFERGSDIKHIRHALTMLKAGGRLVAICANGPRQQQELKPLAEDSGGYYEELPAGTFKSSSTNVSTAILVVEG
jgi:protein-L-isoaspartate O-methyltransferase